MFGERGADYIPGETLLAHDFAFNDRLMAKGKRDGEKREKMEG